MTWLKCHLLFAPPVITFLRRHVSPHVDYFDDTPADALPRMMRSSTRERATAFVYNYVVTATEIRIKRLANQNGRDNTFVNWCLAKHVLLSGYAPDVLLAGEVWSYLDEDGLQRLVLSGNSGTYKPAAERVPLVAAIVSDMLGVPVDVADIG